MQHKEYLPYIEIYVDPQVLLLALHLSLSQISIFTSFLKVHLVTRFILFYKFH